MNRELIKLVEELKRRRLFVSLIVTNVRVQISWWDGDEVRTGDESSAKRFLNAVMANERAELEYVSRRMGLQPKRRFALCRG